MSKKKSRKRVIKTIAPKVAVIFDCPFCDHKKTVDVKIDKKKMVGSLKCKVCKISYEKKKANKLTEPIDVYHEWIDKAEKVNNEKELGGDSIED